MWSVTFTSDRFRPFLPEECQVNPGAYGFELALWLAQRLAARGVVTSYPLGEDWGWLIEYLDGDTELTVGCGSRTDEGEGYTGAPVEWSIFIRPHRTLRQRLRGGRGASEKADRLAREVVAVLEAEGIAAIEEGGI